MRKRSKRGPAKRLVFGFIGGLLLLAVISLIAIPQLVNSYVTSDKARPLAEHALSEILSMDVQLAPFSKSGAKMYSAELQARANQATLQAHELRARVWIDGWFGGVLKIDSFSIREARLQLSDSSRENNAPVAASQLDVPGWLVVFLPRSIEVAPITIASCQIATAQQLQLQLRDVVLDRQFEEITIASSSGSLTSSQFGDWSLRNFQARSQAGELRIVDAELVRRESRASSNISGTLTETGSAALEIRFNDLPLDSVAAELADHLDGNLNGHATYHRQPQQLPSLDGKLEMTAGRVHGLKMLNLVADYTGDQSLRNLPLHTATAKVTHDERQSRYRQIHLESNGRLKLLGDLTVGHDRSLVGNFQLGISAHLIRSLPVDRDTVFELAEDGYYWTPLMISGTVDQPIEDLSARLTASMPAAVLKKSTELLRSTSKSLPAAPASAADAAADLVEQAGDRFLDMLLPNQNNK